MTATLFLGFLAVVAAAVVATAARWLPGRTALGVAAGLAAWLLYVGVLGYSGVLRAAVRPPGMALIVVPAVLFVALALARSPAGGRAALAVPLWALLGLQGFRVGVELFLRQLWLDGLVPKMLTFEGANLDILVGASAPLAAWLAARGRLGVRQALLWNGLGLLSLANVVVRSALTAPGPLNLIHADIPNAAISTAPFMFIPGFFAPLGMALHVLAIRALRQRAGAAAAGMGAFQGAGL